MNDPKRALLEAVARGAISPQEAAEQLAEVESNLPATPPSPPLPPASPILPVATGEVTTVRVSADFGEVRVFGDASVAGAVADGPHTAQQDGSAIVVRADPTGAGGFVFNRRGRIRVNLGGGHHEDRVVVRMNPRLALELDCKAGAVRVTGVDGPIKCDVSAGDVRIDDIRSPVDIAVRAGQVDARGVLDRGASTIRCSAGQVRLRLERGSSVRVRASSRLGNIDLDDGQESVVIGGGLQERVIGGGAGTLDVSATLGQVEIRSQG